MQRRRTAPRQALPDNRLPHLPSSLLTIPWRHAPLNLCQRWRLLQQKGALAITLWLLATLALAALLWGIDQVAGHLGLAIGIILTVAIATLIGGVAVLGEQYWFDYLKGLDELKKIRFAAIPSAAKSVAQKMPPANDKNGSHRHLRHREKQIAHHGLALPTNHRK